MNSTKDQTGTICHVVAVPYPGRGHINPMMNLCKLLTSQKTDILITFVVTEEWFGFIGSEVTPDNIRLATIPNVVPSELVRAADMDSFIEAIMTKMEAPFERLMDRLEPPPSLIVADTFLPWAVRVGNRRSIPAASFWPMPASFFSFFQHFHLLAENGHLPVDLLERGNERVDYIPGVSSTRLADLPFISGIFPNILHHILEDFSWVPKAQYLLFPSIYELEPQVIDPKPDNIQLATIPNVLPSEHGRANHFAAFVEAVWTKLEAPVEQLLDGLEQPVTAIVADTFLVWALRIGIRRNIPVASLWTQSPTMFSLLHHFELFKENGHSPLDVSEHGDEIIEYIPGVSATCIADLPAKFFVDNPKALQKPLEAVSQVVEAQYLLFSSVYELDPQAFEAIKAKFAFAIYPIGPSIPHFELSKTLTTNQNDIDYLHWLDSQPKKSVLYISMGSFLSVSKSQMDEIVAGVKSSGVRVFWVARGDTCELRDFVGDLGLVVPWCDQLRVLCHDSIGGFWSHCGWNSTLEAVYAGLPILTFPILWDQIPNGKQIVEDWRIGYRVKKKAGVELVVSSEEIAELVKKFMDVESEEGKDLRERAKQLQEICRGAIAKGGSSDRNLDAFLKDISQGHN